MGAWLPAALAALGAFTAALLAMAGLWLVFVAAERRDTPLFVQQRPLLTFTRALGRLALPLDAAERAAVAEQLVQAGLDDRTALNLWFAIRGAFAFLPIGPTWLLLRDEPALVLLGGLLVAVTAGYLLPAVVLRTLQRMRQTSVRRAAPTMLDLLVSTLGSGLAVDPALAHVAEEISRVSPPMGAELKRVRARVATGVPRAEALRELARRTGVEEIDALVSLLGQSDRFGIGIAAALRSHAEVARKRRLLEAEQRATSMATGLTVILTLVVLPAGLVVLVGPMILRVAETLLGGS